MMRARAISQAGLALIRRFEGFVPHIYADAAGIATIGYGHALHMGEEARYAAGISHKQAETLLRADAALAARAVAHFITTPLTQAQCDALCSFTFNVGAGALERSTLRRVINRGDHENAPHEFMRWVWAGGKRLPGLITRRKAEAALYYKGEISG